MNVGCGIREQYIVLLAPSWRALQLLLTTLQWLLKLMPLIYTVILIKLLPWYFLRRIVDWSLAMISLCLD